MASIPVIYPSAYSLRWARVSVIINVVLSFLMKIINVLKVVRVRHGEFDEDTVVSLSLYLWKSPFFSILLNPSQF